MSPFAPTTPSGAEIDSALLGVLLSADSVRDGAASLLSVLAPMFDDTSTAMAVRDRDGLTLHTLAEQGVPQNWPTRLEPQFALGAQAGVDPATGVMVAPLRAGGRVVGVLLFGDPAIVAPSLRAESTQNALATAASVLGALVSRNETELRRRIEELRSINTIVDCMAHQISNPLTGVSAIAQLLAEELPDDGQRAALGQIRHELSRAFVVINDVLDFQRDTRAQDGVLDLNTVAERTARFRGYVIREHGIVLDVETAPAFLPVRADVRALEHALLLAIRFAELRSHGTVNRHIGIRVVELSSAELAVEITDSSAGDIPAIVPAFFDAPLQLASPRDDAALPDLALVDSLLRGSGGRLDMRASKTDGTTFSLVVPRAYLPPTSPSSGRNST
jgi:signal transduction histidine kinase